MRLIFVSNIFNHHQKDLSDSFSKLCESFKFVSTMEMTPFLKKVGYTLYDTVPYVINTYESRDKYRLAKKDFFSADVIVIGAAPIRWSIMAIFSKTIVFNYSERQLRNGLEIKKYPYRFIKWHIKQPNFRQEYMLCASAYTAADYAKFNLFKNRCYKWGYFPEYFHYDDLMSLIEHKENNSILWCARMSECKHPENVIAIAKILEQEKSDFHINMIGDGELYEYIEGLIKDNNLDHRVTLFGAIPQEKVRKMMEKSDIFLFTSDFREGWGAVVNEAMNSACAVVSSIEAGSTAYLIKDGINGFWVKSDDVLGYCNQIKFILEHSDIKTQIQKEAYKTISNEWNAKVATERLLELAHRIKMGEKSPEIFDSGPCSKAEIIEEDWYEKRKCID